jgi:hypothetical protein
VFKSTFGFPGFSEELLVKIEKFMVMLIQNGTLIKNASVRINQSGI